jgi:hypothetical protein
VALLAEALSCSVTMASVIRERSVGRKAPSWPSLISGRTSTSNSNSTGFPSSNRRFRTEGSAMGCSDSAVFASSHPSRMTSSMTHCRISLLKRRRTTASGAFPWRKPGRRARRAYWRTALVVASSTRSTGMVTRRLREAASSAVFVMVMALMGEI